MKVAVLSGGRSSEHDVSLSSGASVRDGLQAAGHEVIDVRVGRDGSFRVDGEEVALAAGGGLLGADAAFPALHGPFGEDGTVQGLLECLAVPYVGAGVLASALCMDKVLFKDLMARHGVAQVEYAAVRQHEWDAGAEPVLASLRPLGLPVFVKPARLGSSVGIAKVADEAGLRGAVEAALAHDPLVIVEAMAGGIEVECSVLGPTEAPEASPPGEIVLNSDWYDFEAKYSPGGMELKVPARISERAAAEVQRLARHAFGLSGCHGLARVDFFVDGDHVLLNELNTMPGFTPTSVYPKLWEAAGLTYPELLTRLVELAIDRHRTLSTHTY